MSFYDLPKVRKEAKRPEPLKRMTKETARRKWIEQILLKRKLLKQLKKCDRDRLKYLLTMDKYDASYESI